MRRAPLVAAACLLQACTLGPDYSRPPVELPARHHGEAVSATPAGERTLADTEWSAIFNDPTLTRLVTQALDRNFDLRIATERILQARALYFRTRADQYPTADASVGGVATRASRAGAAGDAPPGADREVTYVEAGIGAGWEIDVWGRLRRLTEAARADYAATVEARHAVLTTLVGDVIEGYLALRALDLALDIATRTSEVAADSLRLTETRYARGVGTALDVRQAAQLAHTARGRLAGLERERAQAENALRLLLGEHPGEVPRGMPLESLQGPTEIPAGLPSVLLERRPDIRRAEQELIAANARIGAAKAAYFPRISLTGFLGVQSRALGDLLSGPAGTWTAAGTALAPIFDGGRRKANVRYAEAVQRELVVNYQRVIYGALREVADALAAVRRTEEERGEQALLVEALRDTARLSTQRYEGGIDTYLQVLDARRQLFEGELQLARLRQRELASVVQLYRALGGGWSASDAGDGSTTDATVPPPARSGSGEGEQSW